MKSIIDSLWHEIRGAYERLPVWLPNAAMAVGDVGTLQEGGWLRHTNLADLKIPFKIEEDRTATDYAYDSSDGAAVSGSLSAPSAISGLIGSGELLIEFSRAGAVLLRAAAARAHRIADIAEVEASVLQLHEVGRWERGWILVTEVVEGGPVVVLVSGSTEAAAKLEIGVGAVAAAAGLADVRGGVRIAHSRNLAASFVASGPAPILWRGRYVHAPWLGSVSMRDRGPDTFEEPADEQAEVRELEVLEDVSMDSGVADLDSAS